MGLAAALVLWILIRIGFSVSSVERLPDFSVYSSSAEKKAAFFDYLRPRVETALEEIRADRQRLDAMEARWKRTQKIKRGDEKWARKLAQHYELELDAENPLTTSDISALQGRVDVIPVSLVLAQASIESGWGSSRFAREGNNLFGMRCYTPGCGLVPKRRAPGATFEVTRFDNLSHCFAEYLHNLNTNGAYADLRRIRQQLRREGKDLSGYSLAPGLSRYSEEGWAYVGKIQSVISSNRLDAVL